MGHSQNSRRIYKPKDVSFVSLVFAWNCILLELQITCVLVRSTESSPCERGAQAPADSAEFLCGQQRPELELSLLSSETYLSCIFFAERREFYSVPFCGTDT